MGVCNSQVAKYSLLILTSAVLVCSCSCALINQHRHSNSRLSLHQSSALFVSKPLDSKATDILSISGQEKSPESNFWVAKSQDTTDSSSKDIPAIHGLDRDGGSLPLGAYQKVDDYVAAPCLISIGIQPPADKEGGKEVWREGVKNCQKMIDSGFNTFRVNNCHSAARNKKEKKKPNGRSRKRKSPATIALEKLQQRSMQTEARHDAETNFYHTLRQSTPSSVLRACHFKMNLEIPYILSDELDIPKADEERMPVPYGNGWMVRESVGNALLRTKGECLDSVVLEYRENSPYHLDTLNTLFEMKDEGLINLISTQNFPPSLLRSALGCGFNIYSNDVVGNLMNTHNLHTDGELGNLCREHDCSRLISSPLAGGLFTKQYWQYQVLAQMSMSTKRMFGSLVDSYCKMKPGVNANTEQKWKQYRSIMDILVELSLKYETSLDSIALRWLLQLNKGDSISVGTHLGMDFVEDQGGEPYSRHRNLRKVFTFKLEKDDMDRLCEVSGYNSDRNNQSGMDPDHEIDFTNRALWV